MELYVRFTKNINHDIAQGTSIITHNENGSELAEPIVVEGLCAFGPYHSMDEANSVVAYWQKWFPAEHKNYVIVTALQTSGPKGSLGTVISAESIKVLIEK